MEPRVNGRHKTRGPKRRKRAEVQIAWSAPASLEPRFRVNKNIHGARLSRERENPGEEGRKACHKRAYTSNVSRERVKTVGTSEREEKENDNLREHGAE